MRYRERLEGEGEREKSEYIDSKSGARKREAQKRKPPTRILRTFCEGRRFAEKRITFLIVSWATTGTSTNRHVRMVKKYMYIRYFLPSFLRFFLHLAFEFSRRMCLVSRETSYMRAFTYFINENIFLKRNIFIT